MRFRFIPLLLILLMLLAIGCQTSSKPPGQAKKPARSAESTVNESRYPAEVRNWLNNMKQYQAAGVIEKNGKTYLVVSGGEKRTGGYTVKISQVKESDQMLTVTVKMKEPQGPSTQVISYPNSVYVLDQRVGSKKIEFISSPGNERIPMVVGCQPTETFQKESVNIKITEIELEADEIEVQGIARVFEGTLNYEFIDQSGKSLSQGIIQAEAGAPDWGCFEIDDAKLPQGASQLQLYWISPKDGSKKDMVSITL